jgi:outer membrane protein assembly factor BamD (BamD/ComL family)
LEKELVFEAMREIRRDGHPDRAKTLLDEYLRRYPQGSLAEEALALAIEAATVLGEPRARNLADRYLSHYPNGRYRSAAEQARSRISP